MNLVSNLYSNLVSWPQQSAECDNALTYAMHNSYPKLQNYIQPTFGHEQCTPLLIIHAGLANKVERINSYFWGTFIYKYRLGKNVCFRLMTVITKRNFYFLIIF